MEKEAEELQLNDSAQREGPKRRPGMYQLVSKKMLHIRPPSHSSVSPSQKSDTSADSSDSCSDGIPTKHSLDAASKHHLPPKLAPREPPQPRIETILSPSLPEIVTTLLTSFGQPSHCGFIDPSFSIYLPPASLPAAAPAYAISFKTWHGVAIMYGDPLCAPEQVAPVFDDFCAYAKRRKWRVAVIGATQRLVDHAVNRAGWGAMVFAVASVLNPTTGVIAAGKGFQTIRRYNRKLAKAGWRVEVYDPRAGRALPLEAELSGLYADWRQERNARGVPQTYSTVLEPWLVPGACRHLYVRDPDSGRVAGLATLIRCGGVDGYVLDPLLALAGTPRGVTESLTTEALTVLQGEGATYLTFGFSPLTAFGAMLNVPPLVERPARVCYEKVHQHLGLGGKRVWHEKWKPERSAETWLLFPPGGVTGYISVTRALFGVSHIRFRDVVGRSGDGSKGQGSSGRDNSGELKRAGGPNGAEQQDEGQPLGQAPSRRWGEMGKWELKGIRNSCMSCYRAGGTLRSIES